MTLRIVPPAEKDERAARIERLKALPRPEGMVQCPRCSGRATILIRHGDRIKDGRVIAGQVIHKGLCAHCWRLGIMVDLIPPKPRIVKESKPRQTKPKLVK